MIYDKSRKYLDLEDKRMFQQFEQSILTSHYFRACVFLRKLIEKNIFEICEENFNSIETKYKTANKKLKDYLNDEKILDFLNAISLIYDEVSSYIHYGEEEKTKTNNIDDNKLEEWILTIENLIYLKKLFISGDQSKFILFSENGNCKNIISNRDSYEFISFFDLIKTFNINIPFYQRGFVWTIEQSHNFIVSENLISQLFLSYPAEKVKEKYVVDGQQRIKSLIIFTQYLLRKHKEILSEEECNAISRIDTKIIKTILINNFFNYFDEHIPKKKIKEIKDSVLNRLFLINNVNWSEQGSVFYSVNFSNTSLDSKEKSFAWMFSSLEMNEQEKLISFLNSEAQKMFYGEYEDEEINRYDYHYLWVNWGFVIDLINSKFNRSYLEKNNPATKQDINFFKKEIKKIVTLVRFFDVDSIFKSLVPKFKTNDRKIFGEIKKYIFNYEKGLKHLTGNDRICATTLLLSKAVLWDGATLMHLKDGNRRNSVKNIDDKIFGQILFKLLYILVEVSEEKIYPSNFFKKNYRSIWRLFSNFLIGINSYSYGLMDFMPSFGLKSEHNEILNKLKESRTEGIMLIVKEIIKDRSFVEAGKLDENLNAFEEYNREINEQKINSLYEKGHSQFQVGIDYVLEENKEDEERFEKNKSLNKFKAANDLELISFLNNYPGDVVWTSLNMHYKGFDVIEWICLPDEDDFKHVNSFIDLKHIKVLPDLEYLDKNFRSNLNIYKKFNSYDEMIRKVKDEEVFGNIDNIMEDLLSQIEDEEK